MNSIALVNFRISLKTTIGFVEISAILSGIKTKNKIFRIYPII
jgi:hypothetical protein